MNNLHNFQDSPLRVILLNLMNSIQNDGCWLSIEHKHWTPIITTLTVELLLSCEIYPKSSWYIKNKNDFIKINLEKSLEWLNNNINDDGSFGEDLWDACKLGILIKSYDLVDYFSNYKKLHNYIFDSVQRRKYETDDSTWAGPGIIASLIEYLDLSKQTSESQYLFQELLNSQLETGEFRGIAGEDGNDLVHPIWHTSQALAIMLKHNINEKDEKVVKIINWIKKTQSKNGSFQAFSQYSIYFTANAIMALCKLKNKPYDSLEKAVGWLVENIDEKGNVVDSGGTIMTALALREYYSKDIYMKANLLDLQKLFTIDDEYRVLKKKYSNLQQELEITKKALQDYDKRYSNADIVLSKKEAFFVSIFIGILLTAISMLPSIVDNFKSTQALNKTKVETNATK